MEDFFATIADRWPAGRDDYHWHVLPGSELLRDRISRPYSEIIRQAGLVPVRPAYLHITIQHLAPVGEVTELKSVRSSAWSATAAPGSRRSRSPPAAPKPGSTASSARSGLATCWPA